VSIELFSVELDAFAHQAGASPTKQIVLVLDGAGWHDSPKVRVPEHVHLFFLPPHSPELQSAEHLWPLTNMVLVNRHFATIEELEDAPTSSARQRGSTGGRSASRNDKGRDERGSIPANTCFEMHSTCGPQLTAPVWGREGGSLSSAHTRC
jgi:transposase